MVPGTTRKTLGAIQVDSDGESFAVVAMFASQVQCQVREISVPKPQAPSPKPQAPSPI